MMHDCEWVIMAQGERNSVLTRCGAPAPLKKDGRWYCADHYDYISDNEVILPPSGRYNDSSE